jgi:alpha-L-arabinofuranosidase
MITIHVSTDEVVGRVSRYLTGACMEDVNHEVYGGIYSQMIFGESFEEEPQEIDARLNPAFAGLAGTLSCRAERMHLYDQPEVRSWQPFRRGNAVGAFQATVVRARRGRHSQKIEFESGAGEVGIENQGLNRWGMSLVAGKPYEGTIVVLAEANVEVVVAFESRDGARVYGEQALAVPGDRQWHSLPFALTPNASDAGGRFAIKLKQPGAVWVDYARVQPGAWGRYKGTAARRDIAEGLVEGGLTVLRYGGYMINTDWDHEPRCPGSGYRWKKMIGPREDRPPYLGTFYPYNSNGFGIVDFVALCEAAGFLCVPAINPCESPQDVADLVEYLNGDVNTPWGARRAADGHPRPYGLRYLQIGNEENTRAGDAWASIRVDYPAHFRDLLQAATSVDPSLTVIMAPWLYGEQDLQREPNRELMRQLLDAARGHKVLFDVHVGGDGPRDADVTERFIQQLRAYIDAIDPGNQVRFCILEENGLLHDLQRALGHAHNTNTSERLGGEVVIQCAANCLQPYLQHDNYWDQGQLFFTPGQVWGMPPYYATQMIARNYQPLCVRADISVDGKSLDITATRSEDERTVVLKVVNLEAADVRAAIQLAPDGGRGNRVRVTTLGGALTDENTPGEPRKIAPIEEERAWSGGAFEHTFGGHSFTILRFDTAIV